MPKPGSERMRYAIYYSPPPDHPLTLAGQRWLGRDAFAAIGIDQPVLEGISPESMAQQTAFPRRYGFHGTVVAPFQLSEASCEADLIGELEEFCHGKRPFELPNLRVDRIGKFIALTPVHEIQALQMTAAAAVARFSRYRAPLSESELARRRLAPHTPRQNALLERWGYPYVMDEFRFHMTLAGPLAGEEPELFHAARQFFTEPLREEVEFDGLALLAEPRPSADFVVRRYVPLERHSQRRTV